MKSFFRARRVIALLLVATLGVGVAACSPGSVPHPPGATAAVSDSTTEAVAQPEPLAFSVDDGAEDVDPSVPVTVTSGLGLDSVEVTNQDGKVVEAELNDDGTAWSTTEVLGYNRTYTIEATDAEGETETITFSTPTPTNTTGVAIGPLPDSTVGVGQAVTFRFTIAPNDRAAVEKAIEVTTSNDTEGGFYWIDPYELRWRPAQFWEPGTEVTVNADIFGLDMGKGLYGGDDNATNFTVGKDIRGVIDDNTKTMTVYENGKVIREIPVSLGRDGTRWATPNGIYVVGDEHESMVMDSSTFGYSVEEGGYVTPVKYATQMSYSGIYIHGAPWATGALGDYNQSHGCVNMTVDDAAWIQQNFQRGDPITVKNTTADTLPGWDGLGYWNIDWKTWKKGNTETGSAF